MRNPFIKFIKIASIIISTILSYSTIDINSAQAANNNASEFFLTAQATQTDVKIEPTIVIGDVINSKANNEAIAVTKLLILLLQNSNLEFCNW
ncbi:hypothetical protein D5R40_21905 [Okeania hirsuta]|uniref:Uncharacterized protein n=2 Tax=Okeania hirsuta TaxID=1458930 RepID=A0A3N6P6I9_9CYAN|nr:hypothetical protein D5R40_21905 [Okeania hirsuta]